MDQKIYAYAHMYPKDHINTDEIIPARYLNMDKEEDLAKHAMEDLDLNFLTKVKKGDVIIAGEDFGCGSSREHAIWALRGAGVRCVIAKSFARIFFRNAINNGFLVIECPNATEIKDGSKVEIDLDSGTIKSGQSYNFSPLSDFAKELIKCGGLMNHIKNDNNKYGNN
ncbi:3-isopropylmalate dehydratase small subunit [Candidatus Woesearchaeota archaeon]|nr:3-isopropylmalate dehydratase small subunit [Candidatus Woesearchaeota archaeon]